MADTDFSADPVPCDDTATQEPSGVADASSPRAHAGHDRPGRPEDAIDPVIERVLTQLWAAAIDPSGKVWSLAKLAKRTQLPQSTLRRYLTSLTEAGIATVTLDEAGLGSSTLTEFGRSICEDLFVDPTDSQAS